MNKKIYSVLIALLSCLLLNGQSQDASFYLKYANKGDTEAMYNLANCYWYGQGGAAQDYSGAFVWYEKAAKKKHLPSQYMTALCYLYGVGTAPNWKTALDWAEKAIKKGYGNANWIKAQIFKEGYMDNSSNGYVHFLTEAANSGFATAQSELGVLYFYGSSEYGVSQNTDIAFNIFKSAAEQENSEALYYFGLCYENGIAVSADHNKALEYFGKSAQMGYAAAQAVAGYCYLVGDSVDIDYSSAYQYFKAAADQDNAYSYGKLGDMYYYGLGVEENNNTAMDMYKAGANLGDTHSMCQLAYMYGYGIGASEDNNLMYKYYKQAADLGDASGQFGLGQCYMYGYGVAKSEEIGFAWIEKAADQGNAMSLYSLAVCYRDGTGTTKNNTKYIELLEQSANLGYAYAMYDLGLEYYGENNPNMLNYTKSVEWFKKAAEAGYVGGQALLGYCYYKGEDPVSVKDYDQAYAYLSKAILNSGFELIDDGLKADIYRCLAGCFRYGRGCEADQSLASYYTELAAKYGDKGSKRATGLLRRDLWGEESSRETRREPVSSLTSGTKETGSYSMYYSVSEITYKGDPEVEIKGVQISKDYTAVYMSWTNTTYNPGWYNVDKQTYLVDRDNYQRYTLITTENCAIAPNRSDIVLGATADFILYFPPLPTNVSSINLCEPNADSGWKFLGIKLKLTDKTAI